MSYLITYYYPGKSDVLNLTAETLEEAETLWERLGDLRDGNKRIALSEVATIKEGPRNDDSTG